MVYLLRFERPIGTTKHRARYYCGWCEDDALFERLRKHRSGNGAAIMRYLAEEDIGFYVVQTWPGRGRTFERRLKNQKTFARFDPCSPSFFPTSKYNRGCIHATPPRSFTICLTLTRTDPCARS